GTNFGSDPSLAFDTLGNVFYSYIVVYFGNGNGINGTAMGVARSSDGGRTYPQFTLFSFEGGSNHFNDKPMIAADTNAASRFRDSVYVAWDAAVGGSTGGGVRFARSTDHGVTFSTVRVDDPHGQGRAIGAVPFVGPNGEVNISFYYTRNDITGSRFMTDIYFTQSRNGGTSWLSPNLRVTDVSSNEHDCSGVFPCTAINYGNQTGDYAGLASYAGVSYPIWTDSRNQSDPLPGCRTNLAMEEVFTATVSSRK